MARELSVSSKELLAKAQELGLPITNQLKGVTEEQGTALRQALAPSAAKPSAPAPPAKAEAAPTAPAPPKPKPKPAERREVSKKRKPTEAAEPAKPAKPGRPVGGKKKEEEGERGGRPRRRMRTIGRVRATEEAATPTSRVAAGPRATRTRRARAARRPVAAPRKKPVALSFPVPVKEFSSKIGVKAGLIIRQLLTRGTPKTMNELLGEEEALEVAKEFGVTVAVKQEADLEKELLTVVEDRPEDLVSRAPVVTLMGHVDHGKTSLLDRIRKSNITEGEHGGITQHIGAYRVRTNEHTIVFLDTPGHEAFTAMRARGAQFTDLVVLVVAADDGVMPQTEEAINHARAAAVPIVVAINKIDRPDSNPMQVKQQLARFDLSPEDWGGKTVMVETSAVTGQGVDQLLEMLALEGELLELQANPRKPARGVALEARLTPGRGVVATVLVQAGMLRVGDVILCGSCAGRVRGLSDDQGDEVKEAGPSTPVEVTGLTEVPEAGDHLFVLDDIQQAKAIAGERERRGRLAAARPRRRLTLEEFSAQVEAGQRKELAVVLKADVQGSAEVVRQQLERLSTEEVRVDLLHGAVGDIGEADVLLADASDAIVIGFNVDIDSEVAAAARQRGVEVRIYRVIYELVDEMRRALEGMLEPERREVALGEARVRQLFQISRLGRIAGCVVSRGLVRRNARVRLRRGEEVLFDGALDSLRRFKNDVTEVAEGYECGIKLAGFDDIQEDDVVEAYTIEEVARTL